MKTLVADDTGLSKRVVKVSQSISAAGTYEMANLYPRDTGLPMTVWVSPRGRARHDARIKVCLTPGDRMDASNTAVVAIRPSPRLIAGGLPAADFALVVNWVALNEAVLLGYWTGALSTVELVTGLRRLSRQSGAH